MNPTISEGFYTLFFVPSISPPASIFITLLYPTPVLLLPSMLYLLFHFPYSAPMLLLLLIVPSSSLPTFIFPSV